MSSGSQARWLAPIALIVAFLAVAFVVTGSMGGDGGDPPAASQEEPSRTGTSTGSSTTADDASDGSGGGSSTSTSTSTSTTPSRESYRVQSGDTFGSISEETGVSVEELQELNPTVDPQSLTVGQRIRLSR